MANIEGTRLEAQDITRVLPTTEMYDYALVYVGKVAFAAIFFFFGLYAGTRLGLTSWLKDCIVWPAAVLIAVLPLNNEALMWILSELNRHYWGAARISPSIGENERPTSPKSIEVGDYIRIVEGNRPTGIQGASQTQFHSQGYVLEGQLQTAEPVISQQPKNSPAYYRVIAKLVSPDTGRVWLAMFGREYYDPDPADFYNQHFRRKVAVPGVLKDQVPQVEKVALALEDLINLLWESDKAVSEKTLGYQLIDELHHDPSVARLAIRFAESGWLIGRKCRKIYFMAEQLKIFNRKTIVTGHENCRIYLAESGRMWKLAGSDYRKTELPELKGTVMGDYNLNLGVAGSIGRENEVHANITNSQWKNGPSLNAKDLAHELAVLRAELRRQSTSPEQDLAIAGVASALLAAEKGDTAGATSDLTNLGSHTAPIRKWIVDTATAIGVPLAVATIKHAWLHLPPGGGG